MDDDKILQKIKKCLALGQSDNPHEAEAALRQARALMEQHDLSLSDVHAADAHEVRVTPPFKRAPDWCTRLAIQAGRAFGCTVVHSSGISDRFAMIGVAPGPEVAAYAFEVLVRQLVGARKRYVAGLNRRMLPTNKRKRGDAFAHGWCDAVERLVRTFAGAPESQAVAIRAYLTKHYPRGKTTEIGTGSQAARDADARADGRRAGRDAELHRGVGATQPKRIGP